ncbi:BspA family leucine-rich repeat surface protein [Fibrobacter sp. UWB13]|uniref:BspA family leucine-rich repeat surface protein n=1 Tax=Fibrobacter sp. UWB13 TaxID=1896204 RepID=UPI000A0C7783|nr:BspA family leucine-rich repeat surface protein [Fibrobacter sp. UWB13]SMG07386.1 surface protein [Fibrobacter sp. UWB13]
MSFFSKLFNNKTNEDDFDSIISKASPKNEMKPEVLSNPIVPPTSTETKNSRIQPKNKTELQKLIKETIEKNGPNCDLNFIDVSCITDMHELFSGSPFLDNDNIDISDFNGDISGWDVSNVINMHSMFEMSKFNGDISKWNVSNVTDMHNMFYLSKFNGEISKWNVSKVTNMKDMFFGSIFTGNISKWNVSNVTNMKCMFRESLFNGDINQWDVSNVTNMEGMFSGDNDNPFGNTRSQFNGDISKWDVSKVTNMKDMFRYSNFHGDLKNWNFTKKWKSGTDITDMFVDSKFTSEEINALFE